MYKLWGGNSYQNKKGGEGHLDFELMGNFKYIEAIMCLFLYIYVSIYV